jgi:hypothetical protein
VLDEGWKLNKANYLDRKLLIRSADGTIAEIQLMPHTIYDVKAREGQALYTLARNPKTPVAEVKASQQKEQLLNSQALGKLENDWRELVDKLKGNFASE